MHLHDVHVGLPPQSEDAIARVRTLLRERCNDPLLDVRWNAECFREPGGYDAFGLALNLKWQGRWQVIRYETDRIHLERPFAVLCTVTAIDPPNAVRKYPIMTDRGAYLPLDDRIVDYMQLWNRAQSRWAAEATKQAWAEHDLAEAITHDHAAHQEGLEKVYRTHGGEYWMGGAQGKAHPDTVRGLWGALKHAVTSVFAAPAPATPLPPTD